MEHISIPLGEIHSAHNWEFANAAARTGASITDDALIGRLALQLDEGTYWRLSGTVPLTWEAFAEWDTLPGRPSVFPPSDHTHDFADVSGLQAALDGKVDKVVGKGLSTEDYSTAEKSKLAGIAAGATVNSTDAALRDRASHTGAQAISTVTGLQTALDAKASTSYVDTQVAALVASSPATLDTLDELAAALGDDPNFATTVATQIGGKEAAIAAGTTAQYWRGDKTWRDFATDVRAAVLTGLSLAASTAVAATDTVLVAFGKLQAQIDAAVTDIALKAPIASPSFTGTLAAAGDATFGTGVANVTLVANGAGSGTAGGAVIGVKNAGAYAIAIGNKSALAGGAYDASGTIYYSAPTLSFNRAGTDVGRIFSTGRWYLGATPVDDGVNTLQVNGGAKASGTITGGILTAFGASAGLIYSNNSSASANSRNFVFGQTNTFGVLDVRIGATLGSDAFSGTILQSWSAASISMAVPLAVTGAISSTSGMTASTYSTNNTGTSATYTKLSNTGGDYYYGVENSAGSFFSGTAYAAVTYAPAGRVIQQIIVGTGVITTASAAGFAVAGLASASGGMTIPLDVYFNTNSSNTGVGWGITENSSTGYLHIAQRTGVGAYSNKLTIGTTGNVMIATATDDGTSALQIAGITKANSFSTFNQGTAAVYTKLTSTGGDYYFGVDNSVGGTFSSSAYAAVVYVPSGRLFQTVVAGTGIITTTSGLGFTVAGALTSNALSTAAPTTKTANYSVAVGDTSLILNGSASITLTLPAAATYSGRWLYLKNIAAFTVVSATSNVIPQAGGAAGTAILAAAAGKWATLQSDGTNWQIMMSN